jgi:hypothetical protein
VREENSEVTLSFDMARSRISASLPDKPSGERWNRKSFDSAARGQVAFTARDQ